MSEFFHGEFSLFEQWLQIIRLEAAALAKTGAILQNIPVPIPSMLGFQGKGWRILKVPDFVLNKYLIG